MVFLLPILPDLAISSLASGDVIAKKSLFLARPNDLGFTAGLLTPRRAFDFGTAEAIEFMLSYQSFSGVFRPGEADF